jgi:hypothetical protein
MHRTARLQYAPLSLVLMLVMLVPNLWLFTTTAKHGFAEMIAGWRPETVEVASVSDYGDLHQRLLRIPQSYSTRVPEGLPSTYLADQRVEVADATTMTGRTTTVWIAPDDRVYIPEASDDTILYDRGVWYWHNGRGLNILIIVISLAHAAAFWAIRWILCRNSRHFRRWQLRFPIWDAAIATGYSIAAYVYLLFDRRVRTSRQLAIHTGRSWRLDGMETTGPVAEARGTTRQVIAAIRQRDVPRPREVRQVPLPDDTIVKDMKTVAEEVLADLRKSLSST